MNEIVSRPSWATGTAVAVPSANAFASYGEQISQQRSIVGRLLKFSKGDFLAGEDNQEIRKGTQFVANMDQLLVGWIKWENMRPVEQEMGRLSEGYQPPKRGELGDNDRSQWETDQNGDERDPWQFSNYLLLKTPGESGEDNLFTFTTSSKGGLGAIGELCKAYSKAMLQRPDQYPVIALMGSSYPHRNKSLGRIKISVFEIVGWAPKAEFEDAEKAAPAEAEPKAKAAAPTRF